MLGRGGAHGKVGYPILQGVDQVHLHDCVSTDVALAGEEDPKKDIGTDAGKESDVDLNRDFHRHCAQLGELLACDSLREGARIAAVRAQRRFETAFVFCGFVLGRGLR